MRKWGSRRQSRITDPGALRPLSRSTNIKHVQSKGYEALFRVPSGDRCPTEARGARNWSLRSREDRIACNGSSRVGMARGRATSFPGYPNCRKGAGVSAGKEPEVSGSSIVRPLLGAAKLDEVSAEARRFAEETGRYPAGTSRNGEVRGLIKRAISAVRNELPQQANPPATPLVFENPPCGGEQNPVRPRLGPLQHAKGCDAWVVATC